ncbi:PH domain-containing protein [Oscillochloris sp. ZM17-4]|uniref:PH domain-containing protein n=1 Tax=Oscillochloris sp. ZM17-4 TaxID=2866714 RepID=UPI001C72B521|nr:PH domain-containing protein [Oscillochloris sp. ZM17-4]MBX0327484.1 PH domain-containing protein [Oscillochloris sp. ZM17-4]
MVNFLKDLLLEDASEALDLSEGEQILHVTGRHWIVLLTRLIGPVLGIIFFGGLAFYRSIGGSFLVTDTGEPVGFDFFNWLLIGVAMVLALLWTSLWIRTSGKKKPMAGDLRTRNILLGAGAVLLLVIYYRYQGGRLLFIDPMMFVSQTLDAVNIILFILAAICLLFTFFGTYDWLNDELILTNKRVVYDNDEVFIPKLIERRVQEQIYIEDIQDVVASTKTYSQHWLGYGVVIVKSARIGSQITFESAANPKLMQQKIMGEVNSYRKQHTAAEFDRMIETKVYNAQGEKKVFKKDIKTSQGVRWLRWLFHENPEINEDNGTITWRAHWIFAVRALIGPVLMLFGGLLVIAIGTSLLQPGPALIGVATAALIISFVAWASWEIEDHRNDLYILSQTNVIDIEKKPFGPEDRRQASLGAVTNVSFETTFISNLLGYGNVVLETAGGGGKFTFDHVPRPRDVVQKINDYQLAFKRGEKEKNLNDTLSLLKHYHDAQQRHQELTAPPAA